MLEILRKLYVKSTCKTEVLGTCQEDQLNARTDCGKPSARSHIGVLRVLCAMTRCLTRTARLPKQTKTTWVIKGSRPPVPKIGKTMFDTPDLR